MRVAKQDSQIRAIAIAFAGAAIAAVAAMFIPVGILESITGSTGLSELLPATRAPLGDTARALIAFGAGAITFAVLVFLLLRQDDPPFTRSVSAVPDWAEADAPSFADRLSRVKLPSMALPQMPWEKGDDDITDLADLPKLRNGDSHPDAPPRRPLSAQQDLPVFEPVKVAVPVVEEPVVEPIEAAVVEPVEAPVPAAVAVPPSVPAEDMQPALSEMVAQLEAAVAERQKQLAQLEAVAAELTAGQAIVEEVQVPATEPLRGRPPLEAVPASVKDDDMDSALAAALATLHRLNGTDR